MSPKTKPKCPPAGQVPGKLASAGAADGAKIKQMINRDLKFLPQAFTESMYLNPEKIEELRNEYRMVGKFL